MNINEIEELIRPICEEQKIHLIEIVLRGSGKNRNLTIYVDTESGITLEQITYLNREISDILDMKYGFKDGHRLEVSSPGLDKPLRFLWQYKKNIDRELLVTYLEHGNTTTISGSLRKVSENEIVLKNNKKETSIAFSNIKKARVKVRV
jgi:ribosome maturation factor RimP